MSEEIADALMRLADFIEDEFQQEQNRWIHPDQLDGVEFAVDYIRREAYYYDPQSWNRFPEREY